MEIKAKEENDFISFSFSFPSLLPFHGAFIFSWFIFFFTERRRQPANQPPVYLFLTFAHL